MGRVLPNILVLHGPNLNLLGRREPSIYGTTTLDTLNDTLITQAQNSQSRSNIKLECKQTNAEHELIEFIHQAAVDKVAFIILNAAALTHTSLALRDALLAVKLPFIEVHITNTYSREPFRHHSYLADLAYGIIMGFGTVGYELALSAAIKFLNHKEH